MDKDALEPCNSQASQYTMKLFPRRPIRTNASLFSYSWNSFPQKLGPLQKLLVMLSFCSCSGTNLNIVEYFVSANTYFPEVFLQSINERDIHTQYSKLLKVSHVVESISWKGEPNAEVESSNISVRDETTHFNSHNNCYIISKNESGFFPADNSFRCQFTFLSSKNHFREGRKRRFIFSGLPGVSSQKTEPFKVAYILYGLKYVYIYM
jgi:hypothetical protein